MCGNETNARYFIVDTSITISVIAVILQPIIQKMSVFFQFVIAFLLAAFTFAQQQAAQQPRAVLGNIDVSA